MLDFRITLEARNPARRCLRQYRVEAGTDLFGVWVVEISYGRIGTAGRSRSYVVRDEGEARHLARSILKRRASAAPHRGRVSHPRAHRSRGVGRGGGALPQERERRDQPRTIRQIAARGLIEEPVGSNDGDPPVTTPGVAQHHQVFSQAGPER